jgi:hypothetical protein
MRRSPKKDDLPSNILDAVYRTVHDFGAAKLAEITGASAGVIDNKANPNGTTPHQTTLADALVWQAITKDFRILHAMSRALGHVAIPLPDLSCISDEALLELMLKIGAEEGDFSRAVSAGFADDRFTRGEYERCAQEAHEWIAAIVETVNRMRGLIDE